MSLKPKKFTSEKKSKNLTKSSPNFEKTLNDINNPIFGFEGEMQPLKSKLEKSRKFSVVQHIQPQFTWHMITDNGHKMKHQYTSC